MIDNPLRIGKFTSSDIVRLVKFGKDKKSPSVAFYTYVYEKYKEHILGKALETDKYSKDIAWGEFLEFYYKTFKLPLNGKYSKADTKVHENLLWAGTPDYYTDTKVGDIKAPKSTTFLDASLLCETIEDYIEYMDMGEKYYWQLVSNALLFGKTECELTIYCPYQKELEDIRCFEPDPNDAAMHPRYTWIPNHTDSELTHIPNDSKVKNIKIINFIPKEEDVILLYSRVAKGTELLKALIDGSLDVKELLKMSKKNAA
jgi:hypothetical protein